VPFRPRRFARSGAFCYAVGGRGRHEGLGGRAEFSGPAMPALPCPRSPFTGKASTPINVILISIDTLRADHLGCYGYHRPTSPNLDGLAGSGLLFRQMIAPNIPTSPGYTSMLSGVTAFHHGVVAHGVLHVPLADDLTFLPEALRGAGYATAAVTNLATMRHWFVRGWSHLMDPSHPRHQTVLAEHVNDLALPWLRQHRRQPFFLFLHYWDTHTPYRPPDSMRRLYYQGDENDPANHSLDRHRQQLVYPFYHKWWLEDLGGVTDAEYLTALYDAEITYVDARLGDLFAGIERLGLADDTAIFVTADHGENMTEHDFYYCHMGLYEPVAHIPLIARVPGAPPGAVEALVQHIDLAPTIADLCGVARPTGWLGGNLLDVAAGRVPGAEFAVLSEAVWQARVGLRTSRYKFLRTLDKGAYADRPARELYDLESDPGEMNNLLEARPEVVQDLEYRLDRWLEEALGNRPNPVAVEAAAGLNGPRWVEAALRVMGVTQAEFRSRLGYT